MFFDILKKVSAKITEKSLMSQLDAMIEEREKTDPMDAATREWVEVQRNLIPKIVSGEIQVKDTDFIARLKDVIQRGKTVSTP